MKAVYKGYLDVDKGPQFAIMHCRHGVVIAEKHIEADDNIDPDELNIGQQYDIEIKNSRAVLSGPYVIARAQISALHRAISQIRRKAREFPAWRKGYDSAVTAIELEIQAIKNDIGL